MPTIFPTLRRYLRNPLVRSSLTESATAEVRRDHRGLPLEDPGIDAVESAALAWLGDAQDFSASGDGGAARHFSLVNGWSTSYPETSGYIVPTLIEAGLRRNDSVMLERARRMTDWLVSIQFANGGFQGGKIEEKPAVPVTFNTGQILMGLAAAACQFGEKYAEPMHRAAAWLVETMELDGSWRQFPSPFTAPGEKVYETHVAWGLIEAARASRRADVAARYADAALRNARWALTKQHSNGWFDSCCLSSPNAPLTHTIGYALRGLTEIFLYTRDGDVLSSALRTADALSTRVGQDGFLSGRLTRKWEGAVNWACVTGSAQIAHSLLLLADEGEKDQYHEAAFRLLSYARRTVRLDGPTGVRGGVRGSFPINGDYCAYEFINWGAKFLIDAGVAESAARAS